MAHSSNMAKSCCALVGSWLRVSVPVPGPLPPSVVDNIFSLISLIFFAFFPALRVFSRNYQQFSGNQRFGNLCMVKICQVCGMWATDKDNQGHQITMSIEKTEIDLGEYLSARGGVAETCALSGAPMPGENAPTLMAQYLKQDGMELPMTKNMSNDIGSLVSQKPSIKSPGQKFGG